MSRLPILLTCALLLTANAASAKYLYVTPTGNDGVSYASNSATTPWRSLGRATWGSTSISAPNAAEAAKAGDVVSVAPGTYATTAATNSRLTPIYNPVNSGTATAPITIRATGDVYLTSSAGGQPIIGTLGRSHIVWDGFILNETNITTTPDTGPMVVWNSHYVTVQNTHIIGMVKNWGDNHNGIRVEQSDNVIVRNTWIEGFTDAGMNATCIMTYDVFHSTLEHNECFNVTTGFFIKGDHAGDDHPQHDIVIRYNYIHNTESAIRIGGVGSTTSSTIPPLMSYVYQNLITNASLAGIEFIGYDNVTPAKVAVINNTFNAIGALNNNEAGAIVLRPGYTGYHELYFRNNLVTNSASGVAAWDTAFNASAGATTFSNNNYYGNGAGAAYIANRAYTLSSWITTFKKDAVGTLALNPQYLSATDFRLASSSPIRNSGLDVLDLNSNGSSSDSIAIGAYITGNEIMGPTSEVSAAALIPPPNLRASSE